MNYLNSLLIYLIISLSCICNAQKVDDTNKAARKIYQKHLSIIDEHLEFFKGGEFNDYAFNKEEESSSFLVNLTSTECSNYDFVGCDPSKENYKDWKVWYRLNKNNLYINGDTVKIKGKAIPVRKNPRKYFISKFKLVKKSIRRKFYVGPEYSNAIHFLRKISGTKDDYYQEELGIDIPFENEMSSIEHWFKKNKNNLFWDVETHSVKLKE